jgi:hypothetical protein
LKNFYKLKFKKWSNVLILILFLGLIYQIYELDIHVWSCDAEENSGSCLLAARIYLDSDNKSMGEKYLRSSCEGKYPLGCYELGNTLINNGFSQEGTNFIIQACELGHEPACPQN